MSDDRPAAELHLRLAALIENIDLRVTRLNETVARKDSRCVEPFGVASFEGIATVGVAS